MYHFQSKTIVTATLISKSRLKSLYSRLDFKVIKNFVESPNFEKARKHFNYESVKSNALQKQIGLQCYLTIPRRVAFLYDNRIELNKNKYVFKYLNEFSPSYDWFPHENINAEVKKKVEKLNDNS